MTTETTATGQVLAGELAAEPPELGPAPVPAGRLAHGGAVLGVATLIANAGNYVLNILLGRWLSPAEFSDASLMVALMLVVTAIALGLQLIAARFVSRLDALQQHGRADAVVRRLRRWAVVAGVATGVLLAAAAPVWRETFQTASVWPFVILGAGMPCYLIGSVGRGVLQGRLHFMPLAGTFLVEMVVRLGLGVGLVAVGGGVLGATVALSASFVATWVAVRYLARDRDLSGGGPEPADLDEARSYARLVAVLLVAQILINNGDMLVAKHALEPAAAGSYAVVALVGRAVFFLSWSVATVVFPAAAHRHAHGHDTGDLLVGGLVAVFLIGAVCTVGAWLVGGPVLAALMGEVYRNLSGQLAAYATATTAFAMANLVASQHLSAGRVRESWVVLAGAVAQTLLLVGWHRDAPQLIGVQLVAMTCLLVAVAVSHVLGAGSVVRPARAEG